MKKVLLAAATILVLFIVYVAIQPAEYVISREITMSAPPEKIFPYLNSVKLADQWGPWLEIDPGMKVTHSGPETGVGAKESWESDGDMGHGSATISESVPNTRVGVTLAYTKPMEMTQEAVYLLEPVGAQTKMIWKVTGKNNFVGRFFCVFMDMDKMVGGMFEKGLTKLKTLVESQT